MRVNGTCRHCGIETVWRLARTIMKNGASLIFWQCLECEKRAEKARNIPHEEIHKRKISFQSIPVIGDYRDGEICARCGRKNVEYHHWAPKHLFKDANAWPGDYLCPDCHREWHDIVTPDMARRKHGN